MRLSSDSQFQATLFVPYPAFFLRFTSMAAALVNVDVFTFLKVGCVMGNRYYRTLVFTTLMHVTACTTAIFPASYLRSLPQIVT